MKRYGEGITRVLNSFGPVPDFSGSEGAKRIVNVSTTAAKDIRDSTETSHVMAYIYPLTQNRYYCVIL